MLTVDDYGRIRRAFRDGMSIREIARTRHQSDGTLGHFVWSASMLRFRNTGGHIMSHLCRLESAPHLHP